MLGSLSLEGEQLAKIAGCWAILCDFPTFGLRDGRGISGLSCSADGSAALR